jgi:uncharacterized repeat protein (TIGR01451 family)
VRCLAGVKTVLAIAVASILCALPGSALAGTITVTSTGDSGAGSLRAAIASASAGETIMVGAGDYEVTSEALPIEKNLTIVGAGARHTSIDAKKTNHGVFEVNGGAVTIEKLKITGAQETGEGGGISLKGGSVALDEVEVTANSVSTGGAGGGIYSTSGTHLTIDASTISNNLAYNGGGLYTDGTTTIEDSTVAQNTAGSSTRNGDGGAIENGGSLTLVNDTIAEDESFNGAGSGGGILGNNVSATNTIVADNSDNSSAIDNCNTAVESKGPNLENGVECGFAAHGGLGNANPLLGALANNGGETETMALSLGSPAIDAGSDEGCPAADQRGVKRPQGASCDIGAFEFQPTADLAITQSASATTLTAGADVTYTLKVSNNGPEGAAGVTVQDTLPTDATLVSAVPSQGTCSGSTPLKCALGTLASGTGATVTLTVALNQGGTNTNTASVSSDSLDLAEANNQSQLAVTVVVALSSPPPPAPAVPVVTHLAQSHSIWLEKKAHGSRKRIPVDTSFSFKLNEAATVTLSFSERLPGRLVKGRCVAETVKNRHTHSCRRMVKRGVLSFSATGGSNRVAFTGRVPHVGSLPAGAYTLTVAAVNAAGRHAAPVTLTFTIV